MSGHQLLGFCFGAIVAAVIGGLLVLTVRRRRLWIDSMRQSEHRASATVVDYERKSDYEGGSTKYPLVQFHDLDGHLVTARTDFSGSPLPDIGDRVEVLLDPEQPETVHIDSPQYDVVIRLFGVIGWVLIIGAPIAALIVLVAFRDSSP